MRASIYFACLFVAGCGSSNAAIFDDSRDAGGTGPGADGAMASDGGDDATPSDSSITVDGTATDSTVTDGTTTDTAKPDADGPLSLDNVCDRLADAVCTTKLGTCCTSRGATYNDTGCRDAVKMTCQGRVDAVNAGDATFDPTAFSACSAAWSTAEGKCSVPILDYVKLFVPCDQLFNGKTAPNDTCTEDGDCHANAGQWVRCSTDGSSVCNAFSVPGKDAPCGYSTGTAAICDYGLACNYTTSSTGTCRQQKMTGAMCANDYECGFGNYCAKGMFGGGGSCAVGLKVGSACSANGQCASGRCNSGSCTDPNFQLAPALCGG